MRLFLSFLMFAAMSVLILTACNSADKKNSKAVSSVSPPADGIRRITVPELQELLANNEAVVIDVRNEDSYNAGHIKGARLIPVSDTLNQLNQLPKDKLIVTYCS